MASSKLLKERIESIQDTMMITNAMYLISSSKLRKARQNYQNVLPYFTRMRDTISRVVPHLPDEPEHPFFHERDLENPKRAYIVLTADKGMAGAYNQNLLKFLKSHCGDDPKARFYVVGQTGYRALLHNIEMAEVFAKSEVKVWECRNCGHIVVGTQAPEVCPTSKTPRGNNKDHAEKK